MLKTTYRDRSQIDPIFLGDWEKQARFEEHTAKFLANMSSVEDFYNVVLARSKWHKMEASMGRKADDYDFFARQHTGEYLIKYKSNEEPDFYGTVSGKTSTAKLGEAENVSITIKDVMYNEFGSKMYAVDGSSNETLSNEKLNTLENKLLISNNSNVLNISGVENLESVEIYNMNGIRVYKNTKSNYNVNISNLTKGLYIIKVETNEGFTSKKFLK